MLTGLSVEGTVSLNKLVRPAKLVENFAQESLDKDCLMFKFV
jgi:hypothetical protein